VFTGLTSSRDRFYSLYWENIRKRVITIATLAFQKSFWLRCAILRTRNCVIREKAGCYVGEGCICVTRGVMTGLKQGRAVISERESYKLWLC
jgi:hypothetical protein